MSATGQVADGTWELGVRRSCALDVEAAWRLLVSKEGLATWLGDDIEIAKRATFELADGTTGKFTVVEPRSHVRLTWQEPSWNHPARLQLRVLPTSSGTSFALHMEQLSSRAQRREQLKHWTRIIERLVERAEPGHTKT